MSNELVTINPKLEMSEDVESGEHLNNSNGMKKRSKTKYILAGLAVAAIVGVSATVAVVMGGQEEEQSIGVDDDVEVSTPEMNSQQLAELEKAMLSTGKSDIMEAFYEALPIINEKNEGPLKREDKFFKCFGVDRWELKTIQSDQVDTKMIYPTLESNPSNIPEALHGLWWMDGNPVADEIVAFGNAQVDKRKSNIMKVLVPGEEIWTWHATEDGTKTYNGAVKANLVYKFTFNEDFTFAKIEPIIRGFLVPNGSVLSFTMEKIDENTWLRPSKMLFGRIDGNYTLRRIVDANGDRIQPTFDDYVNTNVGGSQAQLAYTTQEWIDKKC